MVRVLASLLLVLTLPACAITPPLSVFASLSNYDQPEKPQQAPAGKPVQEASFSTSIGSIWDSVKSGIGLDGTTKTTTTDNSPVQAFDPANAQRLVNVYRAQKGLKPLKLNAKLVQAAAKQAEDLAKSDRLSPLRFGRLGCMGSRAAHGLSGAAGGGECRQGAALARRGFPGLAAKPRSQRQSSAGGCGRDGHRHGV